MKMSGGSKDLVFLDTIYWLINKVTNLMTTNHGALNTKGWQQENTATKERTKKPRPRKLSLQSIFVSVLRLFQYGKTRSMKRKGGSVTI